MEAHVSLGPDDYSPGFTLAVELHVTLPGANVETGKDVVHSAHLICPYSNATRNNIEVKLSVHRLTARCMTCVFTCTLR